MDVAPKVGADPIGRNQLPISASADVSLEIWVAASSYRCGAAFVKLGSSRAGDASALNLPDHRLHLAN